jgi:hypothetical protein
VQISLLQRRRASAGSQVWWYDQHGRGAAASGTHADSEPTIGCSIASGLVIRSIQFLLPRAWAGVHPCLYSRPLAREQNCGLTVIGRSVFRLFADAVRLWRVMKLVRVSMVTGKNEPSGKAAHQNSRKRWAMPTYEDARAKNMVRAMTETVMGIPLDVSDDHSMRRTGYIPILLWCVTEPCDYSDNLIVWAPQSAIREDVATGRHGKDGGEVHEYSVDADAPVVFETYRQATVSDIARLQRSAGRAEAGRSVPFLIRRRAPESRGASASGEQMRRPCGSRAEGHTFARSAGGCTDYEISEDGRLYTLIYGDADVCIYVGEITIQ